MNIFQSIFKNKNKEVLEQDDPEPRLSIAEIESIIEQSVDEKIDKLWNN